MSVTHLPASSGALLVLALLLAPAPFVPFATQAEEAPITLAPHRAVYDLALGRARDASQVASVRGRILYDFDGNACEGYTLKFRQVSELDSGEGKVSTSDLRSTTWEGGDAKAFKFTSENFLDQNLVEIMTVPSGASSQGGTISPDGLTVWYPRFFGVEQIRLSDGASVERIRVPNATPFQVKILPDGKRLVIDNGPLTKLTMVDLP